jgi:hypothetical protein
MKRLQGGLCGRIAPRRLHLEDSFASLRSLAFTAAFKTDLREEPLANSQCRPDRDRYPCRGAGPEDGNLATRMPSQMPWLL